MEITEATQSLNREEAELLDKQIREAAKSVGSGLAAIDGLPELLAKAEAGRIHEVLSGFMSWDEYVDVACAPMREALDPKRRDATVQFLSSAGMTYRQIEAATGVSKSSVQRLVSQMGHKDRAEGSTDRIDRAGERGDGDKRRQSITRAARDLERIASRFADLATDDQLGELDGSDRMVLLGQLIDASAAVHKAWRMVEESCEDASRPN